MYRGLALRDLFNSVTRRVKLRVKAWARHASQNVDGWWRALRTGIVQTDVRRWERVATTVPAWDERNRIIAGLIPPGSSVLDVGSGAQTLKAYLGPEREYQPCDVVKTSDDVLFCDLNAGVYPEVRKAYDYAVCSGVLEYMRRPPDFLAHVVGLAHEALVSYSPWQPGSPKFRRATQGWVNHLSEAELTGLFDNLGLSWTVAGRWNDQVIYRLRRELP